MKRNLQELRSVRIIQTKPATPCSHFGCTEPAEHDVFGPVRLCMVHWLRMQVGATLG